MKICAYLEFHNSLVKNNIGTGILTSYRNQKEILKRLNIDYTEKWDDSCDILQSNTIWIKSLYLIKKAKRSGKKVIIWSHVTVEDGMAVFRFMPLIAPLARKYYAYVYGLADFVFCPSSYTKSLLIAYGLKTEKLVVMSNGVDLQNFYPSQEKRNAGRKKFNLNALTIGSIGQVQPRKGTDTFLKLADQFSNNQFIWVGNFFSKLLVKPIPKDLPSNTKFTGYVDDIIEAYNAMDIFIFPSYEENQGMAILEAAAVGLPIMVRDIPVYRDWLAHGDNCLKAKNDKEFSDHLELLIRNANLREKMSQNSLALAQRESLEAIMQKTKSIYESLLV